MGRGLTGWAAGAAAVVVLAVAPGAQAAPLWSVGISAASHAQGQAQGIPAAPANPTATCSLISLQITVSWTAVAHASSYTVYQSTNGANGTYSVAASGVAATTWTSPVLLLGTYFYKVTATVGSNWVSAQSVATGGHTITVILCT